MYGHDCIFIHVIPRMRGAPGVLQEVCRVSHTTSHIEHVQLEARGESAIGFGTSKM